MAKYTGLSKNAANSTIDRYLYTALTLGLPKMSLNGPTCQTNVCIRLCLYPSNPLTCFCQLAT